MSQYRCHACDVQYRTGSFVPGRVDVCLNCAAENPNLVTTTSLLIYRLTQRGDEVLSEVVCERHYAEHAKPGRAFGPLTESDIAKGYTQTVRLYSGVYGCETCEEEAERAKPSVSINEVVERH